MRGRAELQSGAVLLVLGILGLAALKLWTSGFAPLASGTVFTGQSFASAIIAIMLAGVTAIGIGLIVLGGILWLAQRIRENGSQNL